MATASSSNAAATGGNTFAARSRHATPAYAVAIAASEPDAAYNTGFAPASSATIVPQIPPATARAASGATSVRAGVCGSLSTTYSPSASRGSSRFQRPRRKTAAGAQIEGEGGFLVGPHLPAQAAENAGFEVGDGKSLIGEIFRLPGLAMPAPGEDVAVADEEEQLLRGQRTNFQNRPVG